MYDCIWSNLSLAHTAFYFSYSYRCLTLFISPPPPICPAHTQLNIVSCKSVYRCAFALCMCVSSGAQCFILGLNQASAPEDCRLMWPISSDYSCMVTESLKHTCIHMHSGRRRKKKNHSKEKPQDVVYTFVYFLCVLLNQPAVCHYAFLFFFLFSPISLFRTSVTLSAFSLVTPLSFCPVLLSFYFYIYFYPVFSFISFPFVSSVILAIN